MFAEFVRKSLYLILGFAITNYQPTFGFWVCIDRGLNLFKVNKYVLSILGLPTSTKFEDAHI